MTTTPEYAVQLKGLSKHFGKVQAVKPIDLNIEQGSLVTLLGPSGCGKTTILRMIAGLEHPTSGDIFIKGRRVNEVPIHRRNLGMLVEKPVRSGQQIYAKGRDLIVLAPVGPGAEVIADGNVHIYAPLRGRALAGVMGNENARIFCKELRADLISVAGFYQVSEDLPEDLLGRQVQVRLVGHQLLVEAI